MTHYQDVRSNLLDMLEELDERLTKITAEIKQEDQTPEQDFADRITAHENDEVLDALGNSARVEVEKIKQAINRIDNGTYGICLSCGATISPQRLAAVPYAKHCISCEKSSS